jgi:uncharacterized protein with GYD domain
VAISDPCASNRPVALIVCSARRRFAEHVRNEEIIVAKYVMLLTWTDLGAQKMNQTTQRAAKVRKMAEELGGSEDSVLWTSGRFDIVATYDMPTEEAASILDMRINALGTVRTEMMRARTATEMTEIVGQVR